MNDVIACLQELIEVGDLRGDTQLPHPSDDPILWTARMQEAWDVARDVLNNLKAQAYKNLTYEDSILFETLTMVIAHWPEDRKCPGPEHWHFVGTNMASHNQCHYQFILQQYNTLHMKEYGHHAT